VFLDWFDGLGLEPEIVEQFVDLVWCYWPRLVRAPCLASDRVSDQRRLVGDSLRFDSPVQPSCSSCVEILAGVLDAEVLPCMVGRIRACLDR
jgi:hypothetical protein